MRISSSVIAIERRRESPRRRKVPVLDELPGGAAQRAARALIQLRPNSRRRRRRTAAYGGAGRGKLRLEPAIKRALEEGGRRVLRRRPRSRDRRRPRPGCSRKQVCAESVNGADTRLFELRKRETQSIASRAGRLSSSRAFSIAVRRRSFSSPAAASVKVTATMRSSSAWPARERGDDASHKRSRLASAGRCLDQQVHIERRLDELALVGIGKRR